MNIGKFHTFISKINFTNISESIYFGCVNCPCSIDKTGQKLSNIRNMVAIHRNLEKTSFWY